MDIQTRTINGSPVAVVRGETGEILLSDAQSALDLIAAVGYETGCNRIALYKEAVDESFFDLSTRIAGDILQKFINYQVKLAIVGGFSAYTSRSLRDFICESNQGRSIFFSATEAEALDRLAEASI